MTFEQLLEKEEILTDKLDDIREQKKDLLVKEYKNNIGKCYKFTGTRYYTGYVKIINIWATNPYNFFVEGLHYDSAFKFDSNFSTYTVYEQFEFRNVYGWEEFGLEEITEEEFEKNFRLMLKNSQKNFDKYIRYIDSNEC